MVDDLTRYDPIHKSVDVLRLYMTVGYEMQVVEHDHVCKDQKSTGIASLIESIADHLGYHRILKNRKPVFGDGRKVVGGRIL